MKIVLQRVKEASVTVEDTTVAKIKQGLLILVGIEPEDSDEDIAWLTNKISKLRIFTDENGAMNKSIIDIQGDVIVVSQFTLHASTKKGNRPSFMKAARPEIAVPLYEEFIFQLENLLGKSIQTGIFGATMDVGLINDGPVTIIIDSKVKN